MSWQPPGALITFRLCHRARLGLVVTSLTKVPIWKACRFNGLHFTQWDRREIGGQAAIVIGGHGSLAGWNFCPKPEPSVPL